MSCKDCNCTEEKPGKCKQVDVKILREEGVSEHDLSDEEFEKIIKDAYNRFKPTMERLK